MTLNLSGPELFVFSFLEVHPSLNEEEDFSRRTNRGIEFCEGWKRKSERASPACRASARACTRKVTVARADVADRRKRLNSEHTIVNSQYALKSFWTAVICFISVISNLPPVPVHVRRISTPTRMQALSSLSAPQTTHSIHHTLRAPHKVGLLRVTSVAVFLGRVDPSQFDQNCRGLPRHHLITGRPFLHFPLAERMTRVRHHHQHHQSRRNNSGRADNNDDEGGESSRSSSASSSSSRSASASHTSCTTAASSAPTTRSPPLAMASSARDRLQASARELFKNLEEAFMSPGGGSREGEGLPPEDGHSSTAEDQPLAVAPWEAALRTVFSACTTGAEQNTVSEPDERSKEGASSSSLARSSAGSKKPRRRAVGTPTGNVPPLATTTTTTARNPVVSSVPPPQHRQDMGEHIYAQLFFDDQLRAARAVQNNSGGTFPTSGGETPQQLTLQSHQKVSPSPLSSPFPVSSPQLRLQPTLMASPPPAITATELNISQNLTFDDSISAISAHTLEAMAHNHHHHPPTIATTSTPNLGKQRSGDSTLFPPASLLEDATSPHGSRKTPALPGAAQATLGASPSPFFASPESGGNSGGKPTPLSLYRSHSNNSRHSKNSHSTRTTESSSFDQWQQEDAKYWAREAQRDAAALERQPPPSSSRSKHPSKSPSQQHRRKVSGTGFSWERNLPLPTKRALMIAVPPIFAVLV